MTRILTFLDRIYEVFAWLAALSLIAMLCAILLQVVGAVAGFHIAGLDSYAVYAFCASMYLALAAAMNRGEHIRVTMLIERLPARYAVWIDRLGHLLGAALAIWMSWAVVRLVVYSWAYNEVSLEMDATPLWIPQSVVVIGTWVFTLALVDRTVRLFCNAPLYRPAGDALTVE